MQLTIREKILRLQNHIVIAFVVIVVIASCFIGKYENTSFWKSYKASRIDECLITDSQGNTSSIELPITYNFEEGQPFTLSMVLPDDVEAGDSIMMLSNYCHVEIYVDGELITEYAKEQPLPYGKLTGNIRVSGLLPEDCQGKTLDIVLTSYYTAQMTINPVFYGNSDALKLRVVYINLWRIVIAVLLLSISLVSIGISFIHHVKRAHENNWAFYHVGCLFFYMALWLICSSDIPQLFINFNGIVSFVSFLALSLIPIHMAAFFAELLPNPKDIFRIYQIIFWFVPFLEGFGYVTNLFDPPSIVILSHLAVFIVIVTALVCGLKAGDEYPLSGRITVSNFIILFTVLFALIAYYLAPTGIGDAIIVGLGASVYSVSLLSAILLKEAQYIEESRTNEVYRTIAFMDIQTSLKNRGAFNRDMEKVDKAETAIEYVDLIIMDLNGLKQINDSLGHLAGDRYIINTANCIKTAFGEFGECYRIGGDEFAVLAIDKHDMLERCLVNFECELVKYNSENEKISLSASIGVASSKYLHSDRFMEDLFMKADQAMYDNKRVWHNNHFEL